MLLFITIQFFARAVELIWLDWSRRDYFNSGFAADRKCSIREKGTFTLETYSYNFLLWKTCGKCCQDWALRLMIGSSMGREESWSKVRSLKWVRNVENNEIKQVNSCFAKILNSLTKRQLWTIQIFSLKQKIDFCTILDKFWTFTNYHQLNPNHRHLELDRSLTRSAGMCLLLVMSPAAAKNQAI